jgi:hypothetical protein
VKLPPDIQTRLDYLTPLGKGNHDRRVAVPLTGTPMFRARQSIPRLSSRCSGTPRLCLQAARCYVTKSREVGRPKNLREHFSPDKLATSDQYPLTHELIKTMHPSMLEQVKKKKAGPGQKLLGRVSKSVAHTYVRSQIVSPDLCGMLCLGSAYCRTSVLTANDR